MKHLLWSQDLDMSVQWFDKFNPNEIKEGIIKHLQQYPNDVVEHCKEYNKQDAQKYYGFNILNYYQNNKQGKPCTVITKGSKEFLKPLK